MLLKNRFLQILKRSKYLSNAKSWPLPNSKKTALEDQIFIREFKNHQYWKIFSEMKFEIILFHKKWKCHFFCMGLYILRLSKISATAQKRTVTRFLQQQMKKKKERKKRDNFLGVSTGPLKIQFRVAQKKTVSATKQCYCNILC